MQARDWGLGHLLDAVDSHFSKTGTGTQNRVGPGGPTCKVKLTTPSGASMLWPMCFPHSCPSHDRALPGAVLLWLLPFALSAIGCGGDVGEVQLDLCPGQMATDADRTILRSATTWELTVFGLRGDSVVWHDEYAGATLESLSLSAEIPPEEDVRLSVEGWSGGQLVGIATSGVLSLRSGVRVCLCTAQPERYEELCPHWECSVNPTSRVCWQ